MANKALAAYFEIDAQNYAGLIGELLVDTAKEAGSAPDNKLLAARRAYFEIAIARGAELPELPWKIKDMSAAELAAAARALPDKEALGFLGRKTASLNTESRTNFAAAAAKRAPAMRWDNLFEGGQDDIILPFVEFAQSHDDKIGAYIERYNLAAAENLAEARAQDEAAQRVDPGSAAQRGQNDCAAADQARPGTGQAIKVADTQS